MVHAKPSLVSPNFDYSQELQQRFIRSEAGITHSPEDRAILSKSVVHDVGRIRLRKSCLCSTSPTTERKESNFTTMIGLGLGDKWTFMEVVLWS